MNTYRDFFFTAQDGINLYARDYPGNSGQHVILCLHGLTRNSADFGDFCQLMPNTYRFVVADQRGRGRSDYDDNTANYQLQQYVGDTFTLMDKLLLDSVVLVGTSMGGLMALIMAAMQPNRFKAIVLNDVGPEVDPQGLERIKRYAGEKKTFADWNEAVDYTKQINEIAFPRHTAEQWQAFAHNLFVEKDGVPVLAYDARIMEPIQNSDNSTPAPDLWPAYETLSDIPMHVVRGETSDILSRDCVTRMKSLHTNLGVTEVAGVGHAPLLNEPEAIMGLKRFFSGL